MEIKKIIPPVIIETIRKNRKVIKYTNYEEALSYCTINGYHNDDLCNMIADKTLIYRESLKSGVTTVSPTTVYLAFALNFFSCEYDKKNITVVDFGGACGSHYYEVRNILPRAVSLNWIIIETESMIQSAVSRGLNSQELSFNSKISEVNIPVDFIHSSSALQYVPEPYKFLKELLDLDGNMILFNRMMFNEGETDIVTVQRSLFSVNGPGKLPAGYVDRTIKYPHTTMSLEKFKSQVIERDYSCLSEFSEPSGSFSLGKEKILGKGLLYLRKRCTDKSLLL